MAQLFEIRAGAESVGSYSGDQIRQMAANGRLHAGMEIRRLPSGEWAPISRVKGLHFKPLDSADAVAAEPSDSQDDGASDSPAAASPADTFPLQPSPAALASALNAANSGVVVAALASDPNIIQSGATQTPPLSPTAAPANAAEIECPFCAEPIKPTAKKCKHCGEFLDENLRAAADAANVRASDSSGQTAPRNSGIDRSLDSVAMYQNRLRYCGLAFWLFQLLTFMVASLAIDIQLNSELVLYSPFVISWLFNYATAVFAFFLALKVFDVATGTVLGLLGLIPYIGPAAFVAISVRASRLLRQHGRRGRPRWLAVAFPPAILTPSVFIALTLSLTVLSPLLPEDTSVLILLGTAIFFGGALVIALLGE